MNSNTTTHLLFVFVIHMKQQVKHEMKSHKTCMCYIKKLNKITRWDVSIVVLLLDQLSLGFLSKTCATK